MNEKSGTFDRKTPRRNREKEAEENFQKGTYEQLDFIKSMCSCVDLESITVRHLLASTTVLH